MIMAGYTNLAQALTEPELMILQPLMNKMFSGQMYINIDLKDLANLYSIAASMKTIQNTNTMDAKINQKVEELYEKLKAIGS